MGIIDQYWSGVLQRIQTEVEVFNRLIGHQGERGRENELSLARMLHGLLPGRLGIGSGLLFDVKDKYSKQMDVVLFDQVDSPTALAQTNQVLFPVEEGAFLLEALIPWQGSTVDRKLVGAPATPVFPLTL